MLIFLLYNFLLLSAITGIVLLIEVAWKKNKSSIEEKDENKK